MEIREIKLSEINNVLNLIDEYDRKKSKHPSGKQIKNIYDNLISTGGEIIGAFDDEKLIGTCTLNLCPNLSWSGRPYAIIENVIVTKKRRNEGVGKSILNFALKLAENKNCYKVALLTGSKKESVHKFYKTSGFTGSKTGYQKRFNA